MTEEFCQSIVRTAVRIANECDIHEILQYIRCEAWFTPAVKEIEIGKQQCQITVGNIYVMRWMLIQKKQII